MKLRRMPSEDDMDMSHPSRGAWIEMALSGHVVCVQNVAPLAGCVD